MIAELLAVNALFRLRAAQGVLGLAGKHGADRLEAACAKAIEVGDPQLPHHQGHPRRPAPRPSPPPSPTGDGGAAAHLHGPSQLFGNVVALPRPSGPPTADTAAASGARPDPGHDEPPVHDEGGQPERAASDQLTCEPDPTSTDQPADGRTRKHHDHPRHRAAPGAAHPEAVRDAQTLDARLAQARAGELGHLDFLQVLCHDEIARRETQAVTRRLRRAQLRPAGHPGRVRLRRQPETARRADP